MGKKILLVSAVVIFMFLAAGCSSKPETASQTSNTSSQQLSDVDPWLKTVGFARLQLTDPILYAYLQTSGVAQTTQISNLSLLEQKRVGQTANFTKSSKYNISGVAEIVSSRSIAIKSFSYNGSCGAIYIRLAMSNAPGKTLATLKTVSTPISSDNGNFSLTIPSNISLIQFNQIVVLCPDKENPVSTASFQ